MTAIRFECPNCAQSIEAPTAAIGEQITCPTCAHEFVPDARMAKITDDKLMSAAEESAALAKAAPEKPWWIKQKPTHLDWEKTRRSASNVSLLMVFSFVFTGICLLGVFVQASEGGSVYGLLFAAGGCLSLGLTLAIIAQLLQIRAALEQANAGRCKD